MSDDAGLACHREQFSLERWKDGLRAVLVGLLSAQCLEGCWKSLPGLLPQHASSADLHRATMKQPDSLALTRLWEATSQPGQALPFTRELTSGT